MRGEESSPLASSFWGGARWLSENIELLGVASVALFLAAIAAAIAIAPRVTPSQSQIEIDRQAVLRRSLASYVARGDYIVRADI